MLLHRMMYIITCNIAQHGTSQLGFRKFIQIIWTISRHLSTLQEDIIGVLYVCCIGRIDKPLGYPMCPGNPYRQCTRTQGQTICQNIYSPDGTFDTSWSFQNFSNWIQCDMPCGYCNTTFMCELDCPGASSSCTTAQCGWFGMTAPAPCRTCRCDDDCRGDGVTIPYTCCDDYESTCGVWLGKQGHPTTGAPRPHFPAWDSFAAKNCNTRSSLQCMANTTHDYCWAASSTIAGDAYFGFVQKHWSCPPDPGNDCCIYTPQNNNDPKWPTRPYRVKTPVMREPKTQPAPLK
eukprot:g6978.t1